MPYCPFRHFPLKASPQGFVRLACLIHAANVRSEPGSNPSKLFASAPAGRRGPLTKTSLILKESLLLLDSKNLVGMPGGNPDTPTQGLCQAVKALTPPRVGSSVPRCQRTDLRVTVIISRHPVEARAPRSPGGRTKSGDHLLSRSTHYHRPWMLNGRVRNGNGWGHPGLLTGKFQGSGKSFSASPGRPVRAAPPYSNARGKDECGQAFGC